MSIINHRPVNRKGPCMRLRIDLKGMRLNTPILGRYIERAAVCYCPHYCVFLVNILVSFINLVLSGFPSKLVQSLRYFTTQITNPGDPYSIRYVAQSVIVLTCFCSACFAYSNLKSVSLRRSALAALGLSQV